MQPNAGGQLGGRLLLALCLLAGGLSAAHASAPAALGAGTSGACPTTAGVTVVVDYGAYGGVSVRCAPGGVSSGLDALARSGFSVELVNGNPFVCHINGQPNDETCADYPSAGTPSWIYWEADRGGTWSFSSAGAGYTKPRQGSVEGWVLAVHQTRPGIAPPAAPQPTPSPTPRPTARPTRAPTAQPTTIPATSAPRTPKPTSAAPGASAPVASAPDATPAVGSASPVGTAPPADIASATGASTAAPSPDPSSAAAVATDSADPAEPASATGPADPGAPPVGTIAGLVLVVALVAVGGLLARRRSSPDA